MTEINESNPEQDPWWARYWYASVFTLSIWMIVAIYGAINYDLELADAAVTVRENSDGKTGKQIFQIELWLVVVVVPLSLVVVNALLAFSFRSQKQSD